MWKTILINDGEKLTVKDNWLVVSSQDGEAKVPIGDIYSVVVDNRKSNTTACTCLPENALKAKICLTRGTSLSYNNCIISDRNSAKYTIFCGFSSLMDIDKLIRIMLIIRCCPCFSSLMDIDKLIPNDYTTYTATGFSSLMDIDKLIHMTIDVTSIISFSSLIDIDKLILACILLAWWLCFSSLMDIDKLIRQLCNIRTQRSFSSLMDIDKLIQ